MNMRKLTVLVSAVVLMVSCNEKKSDGKFSVDGELVNNSAKKLYLEEVPATTMQPVLVDSCVIGKDGNFSLKGTPKESVVFNLLFDHSVYPVVSVISDTPHITLNIKLAKENNQFPESYDVKGSVASEQ